MERIKLDLVPSCIKPVLHASQYDDGRQWACDILNGGTPHVFQSGDTVDYTIRKGDGLLVTGAVAVTPGTSYIILVSTEQMCAVFGSNLGELTITSNGTKVGSVNFILEVERAPDENGITSQSEIKNLERQVHDIVVEELADNGAEETGYDNTESGLDATNVQDAIDELASQPSVDAYTKQESDAFITDEYDATSTYAIGVMVIHENALYVCSTAITTAEAWNSAHWTLSDIATAIGTVKSAIPTKTSDLQNDSGFAQIDDSEESASKTWSSEKIEAVVGGVQSEVSNLKSGETILVESGYFTNAQKSLDSTLGYDTVKYYSDKNVLVATDKRTSGATTNVGINFRDFGLDATNGVVDISERPCLIYKLESDIPSNVAINLTVWFLTEGQAQKTKTIPITTRGELVNLDLQAYATSEGLSASYKYAFVVAASSVSFTFTTAYLNFEMFGFFTKNQADNYNLTDKIETIFTSIENTDEKIAELDAELLVKIPTLAFGGYISASTGEVTSSSYGKCTDYVEITLYDRLVWNTAGGNSSVARVAFYNADKTYLSALTINDGTSGTIDLSDVLYENAKYVRLSYYDYPNKDFSGYAGKLYKNNSIVRNTEILSKLNGTDRGVNVLIFGDSITDCASFTIVNDKTTAYSMGGTNSYVDGQGHTITYKMWAKIFEEYIPCAEIRNYACSGASYQDQTSPSNPRKDLSYQMTVALNDLDNPNGAFVVDNFNPDVIIFALGTNDGQPDDTPNDAYAKIVTTASGFDIDSTLSALDRTKFCEAVLWAYFTARKNFPYALILNVLPLQRMSDDNPTGDLHSYLQEISQRYGGAVCIDGTYESGIVKENNVKSGLGATLKDGLHPNEKGQNMLARLIIGKYKSYYVPFDYMNP